jgi:YVTN family beta-propeller protein
VELEIPAAPHRSHAADAEELLMNRKKLLLSFTPFPIAVFLIASFATRQLRAQMSSPSLLVLEKADNVLAIVDPVALKIDARVPAGKDPHEVAASSDGKLAYISNYGGLDSDLHTISVVDLTARTALTPIDLGALHSVHGLDFVGRKLYFTVETNKAIGRYDPSAKRVDWVLGTGQDRTHMIWVAPTLDQIFTSNVNSGTISLIEYVTPELGYPPPPGTRKTWEVTNVRSGRGSEGFDVSPDGKEIWAANAQDDSVTIIDVATKKTRKTLPIPVKGANRLKFTLDGKRVLVSGLGGPSIAGQGSATPNVVVIDATTRKEIKRLSLGGGSAGILMQPGGSRAFVAVSAANKVAVLDLNTLAVTGEIQTGRGPDGLAWAAPQ